MAVPWFWSLACFVALLPLFFDQSTDIRSVKCQVPHYFSFCGYGNLSHFQYWNS